MPFLPPNQQRQSTEGRAAETEDIILYTPKDYVKLSICMSYALHRKIYCSTATSTAVLAASRNYFHLTAIFLILTVISPGKLESAGSFLGLSP